MKEIIVPLAMFIAFICFIVAIAIHDENHYDGRCKQEFGLDNSYEGGRIPTCVNAKGEARFLRDE